MVKKSIIAFVGFFILLECCLRLGFVSNKWIESGQNIWAINVINAQNFLYEFEPKQYNCVIGSSISYKLTKEILPQNLCILSFNGLSVHDGLFVLKKKEVLPDTLFVETNVLERASNEEFSEKIGKNKFEVELKRYISGLRNSYAPINLIVQFAASGAVVLKRKIGITDDNKAGKEAIDLMKELEVKEKKKEGSPGSSTINILTDQLFSDLEILHKKGVTIVLFDMPVDCRLDKKDNYYSKVYQRGKEKGFFAIKRVQCAEYKTSDGTHLESKSAEKYTKYFLENK